MLARVAPWVVLLLVVATGLPGCASRREAKARANAPDLVVAQPREDLLHCSKGQCANLYRLVVETKRRVRVQADAPADPRLPDFSLVLEDRNGNVVADDRKANQRPRRITETLEPGLYFVRILGQGKNQDRLSYKLVANQVSSRPARRPRTAAPRAAPRIAPAPVFVDSDVLEVERAGGEPIAVLIEAGTSQGMAPGLAGELVDGGEVIGKLEIVDVYAEGSRARIVGGLKAPITLDTRARVAK